MAYVFIKDPDPLNAENRLKVVGNEKQWVSERRQMLDNGLGPW
jgi:hypothetical protein